MIQIIKKDIVDFYDSLKRLKLNTNFYCNKSYLTFFNVKFYLKNNILYSYSKDCDKYEWLFPPLPFYDFRIKKRLKGSCWIDFENYSKIYSFSVETIVLDREYIYLAKNFQNISGGKWETFRKNIRKWKKNKEYSYLSVNENLLKREDCKELIKSWIELKYKEIFDIEFLFYLLEITKEINKELLIENTTVKTINISQKGIDYEYFLLNISNLNEKYLNEFSRYLFFTNVNRYEYINDGGDLDKETLRKYKIKMNPKKVLIRKSILF